MKCIEKAKELDKLKNYPDAVIMLNFCPDRVGIYLVIPTWCKQQNSSTEDCKQCWEREIE